MTDEIGPSLEEKLKAWEERNKGKAEWEDAHPAPVEPPKPPEQTEFEEQVKELHETLALAYRVYGNLLRTAPVGSQESKTIQTFMAKTDNALKICTVIGLPKE